MKLQDQPLPPDQPAAYRALVSSNPPTETGANTARARRRARRADHPHHFPNEVKNVRPLAQETAKRLGHAPGTRQHRRATTELIHQMIAGYFDPRVWTELTPNYVLTLQSTPTSVNDDGYSEYPYTDPNNKRTTPTYYEGTEATGEPRYTGSTSSGRFRDTLLVWRRYSYTLPEPITGAPLPLLALRYAPTLTVDASTRASRMMYQLLTPYRFVQATDDEATQLYPPVWIDRQIPSPWRPPITSAPYYHDERVLNRTRRLNYYEPRFEWTYLDTLSLWTAPEPMRGHAFNNNTSVATTLAGDATVYYLTA